MSNETVTLEELPEQPTGWTMQMQTHLNFGRKGGSMAYAIYDEKNRLVAGLGAGYDTRLKQRNQG